MVYLCIHGPDLDETTQERHNRNADFGESALWYPELPDSSLQLLGVTDQRLSRRVRNVPYSLCLFGGRGGELLPHLTDINVWIVDRTDHDIYGDHTRIWAMEFHFNDHTVGPQSMTFGRVPDPDISERQCHNVSLDSPNGERITGVDTWYDQPESVFAITVSIYQPMI
jgi:hypothetical protein